MIPTALLVSLLLGVAPSPAVQGPAPAADSLAGTWVGPYQSDQAPPGGLKLVLAREEGAWKAVLTVESDPPMSTGEVRELRVEGATVSWVQTILEFECAFQAVLEAGLLKGGAECAQGGAVVATSTFALRKQ